MSIKIPSRPLKGHKIPANWFQDFHDYVASLEVRGDLKSTTVTRDRSGTVVHAHKQGGSTNPRINTIIAQIDTDNNDGTYDATEQQNASGTFSDRSATTGMVFDSGTNGNLYELNGIEGVPVGTFVVVHRVADTNGGPIWYFDSGYDGRSFWAKVTGETTGSYSWTELEGDASTTTARTGTTNASEVSGRLGIPTNSIVRMFPHPTDNADFQFEYHGAHVGTAKDCNATGTSADSASFDRENQSTLMGVDARLARVDIDFLTAGHSYFFGRDIDADANGHLTDVSSETRTEFTGALYPVKLTQTGGSAGNATTACTLTYTVKTSDSVTTLLTVASPTYSRPAKGKLVAATNGMAYVNGSGTVVLLSCDEVPDVTVCS